MARPRSEEKQIALLKAASEIIALHGIGAATLLISKQAGVAEGTLFRYFPTKDDLLNELYLYIKQNLGEVLKQNCRQKTSLNDQVHALWSGYIDWGIANPAAIKTLKQLSVSDRITPQTHAKVAELLPEIHEISSASVASGHLAALPQAFADAIFMALADTTMLFAAQNPEQSEVYKAAGFNILWKGLTQ